MAHWLIKTEPSEYSFDDLLRDKKTTWNGVTNPQALGHIRAMKKADRVLVYHTGDEKRIVGIAEVISSPYSDPENENPKLSVVDIKPVGRVPAPVTLAQVKADPAFGDFLLVRLPRLSVMPVGPEHWEKLRRMCEL